MEALQEYYVASYSSDGEFVGRGLWLTKDLSPKWRAICRSLIEANEPNFDCSVGQGLSHVRVKLTSIRQTGLGMFFVRDQLALSTAYLGSDGVDGRQVLRMFLESLRNAPSARGNLDAFPEREELNVRPLHIAIPWGADISSSDRDVVRELSTHFAAAYFEMK